MWQQYVEVRSIWNEFEYVFGTSEDRIDVLNATIPGFARLMQEVLWRDVLLALCRLSGAAGSGSKRRLTVTALTKLTVRGDGRRERVATAVQEAVAARKFAWDWRNRYIAHTDLDLATNPAAHPLQEASRRHVRHALQVIGAALNAVEREHGLQATSFGKSFDPALEAPTLQEA